MILLVKTKKYFKANWSLLLLILLAVVTRFYFLSYPAEVVFDEVHFGKFVSAYFNHQYYFDIHPPLGKLMIAGFAEIAGFSLQNQDPEKIFSQIGEGFNKNNLFVLRFLPALFGVFFIILIYKLALIIGLSKKAAFLAGFLVLFDNAYLIQSKFILVDIFLLVFGFSAIYFFLLSKKYNFFGGGTKTAERTCPKGYPAPRGGVVPFSRKGLLFLISSAVFSALAFSIKWTGLSFLGIIVLWLIWDLFRSRRPKLKNLLLGLAVFFFIPFLVYFSVFYVHFKLLYKSGWGNAFMTPAFQKTLSGNTQPDNIKPLFLAQKFIELNSSMYRYNKGITASHPYSSKWYQWPTTRKPIWYWTKNINGKTANIYLLGNAFIWWPVLLSVILSIFLLFKRKFRKKISPITNQRFDISKLRFAIIYVLIFGYFINLIPFILIGRVTFLYHYLPSLTFGILIFSLLTEKTFNKSRFLYFGYLLLVFLMFLSLVSLSYGFMVSNGLYKIFI